MNFEYLLKTALPLDIVYKTLRDKFCNLIVYLPNVDKIEELERKELEDRVYVSYKWYGRNVLPLVVEQFVNLGEIAWLDKAEWINSEYICNWSYEPFIFKKHVNAHGTNFYTTDGKDTLIRLTGSLDVHLGHYPLPSVVPSIIKKVITDEFSKVAIALIKPNFVAVIQGLEKYIEESG